MAEIEDLVAMCIGLGDVEVAPNQGDEEGVKEVVQELVEDLVSLVNVCLAGFEPLKLWRL